MEYLPALGAGMVIAAVATMLRFFYKLLSWEHKRAELRLPRQDARHHRWLHARRSRQAPMIRTHALARR